VLLKAFKSIQLLSAASLQLFYLNSFVLLSIHAGALILQDAVVGTTLLLLVNQWDQKPRPIEQLIRHLLFVKQNLPQEVF
jgi:hypothetical protein